MAQDALFNTKIVVDTSQASSQVLSLENKLKQTADKATILKQKLEDMASVDTVPTKEYADLAAQLEKADQELAKLVQKEEQMVAAGKDSGANWDAFILKEAQAREKAEEIGRQMEELAAAGKDTQNVVDTDEYKKISSEYEKQKGELAVISKKLDEVNSKTASISKETNKTSTSFEEFGKKTKKVGKNILKLFGAATLITAIRRVIMKLVAIAKEGFNNMAKESPALKESLGSLQNSLTTLKNALATAFAPIVTAVIPYINHLVSAITTAVDKIAQFWAALSGKSTYTKAKKAMDEYGKSTAKASKSLANFDELNQINENGGGGSDYFEEAKVSQEALEAVEKAKGLMDSMGESAKDIAGLFLSGFTLAFDTSGFEELSGHISSIGDNLKGIFTDPEVTGAFATLAENYFVALGQMTGSMGTVGGSLALAITGGFDEFLTNGGGDQIKGTFATVMTELGTDEAVIGSAYEAAGYILSAFGGENAQNIVADYITIFADAFSTIAENGAKLKTDLDEVLLTPLIENKETIKQNLDDILGSFSTVTDGIKQCFDDVKDKFTEVYDEHLRPMFDKLKEVWNEVVATLSQVWAETGQPLLDDLAQQFSDLWSGELSTFFTNVLDHIGQCADYIKDVVLPVLKTVLTWIIKNLVPMILNNIKGVASAFAGLIKGFVQLLNGWVTTMKGFLQIITGLLTGNMQKVEEGVNNVLGGIWKILAGFCNQVIGYFSGFIGGVVGVINSAINAINSIGWDNPVTGEHYGANIPNIPAVNTSSWGMPTTPPWGTIKLANGGMTTGTTLATIGEAGKEAVIPLERNTEWATMLADILTEKMGGNNYTFTAQLDGKTLFQETVNQSRIYENATGRNAFIY